MKKDYYAAYVHFFLIEQLRTAYKCQFAMQTPCSTLSFIAGKL